MESEPILTPRGKFPLPEKEDRNHNAASSGYSGPLYDGCSPATPDILYFFQKCQSVKDL